MIQINLVRDLQPPIPSHKPFWFEAVIGGMLFLLAGLGSGWWAHTLQIEKDALLHEKTASAQSLLQLRETSDRLSQLKNQRDGMIASLQHLQKEISSARNPADFLDMIGKSLQNLQIWLDSIQMSGETIEIHGQAYLRGDVGECIDRLESTLPIRGLPFVEIQEGSNESAVPYSFSIRFAIQENSVT